MKHLIYNSLKLTIGIMVAIIIASVIGLQYATTAGVIALLSILNTRKQTYITGIKRIGSFMVAIIISAVLFTIWGHTLYMLALFLIIFIPVNSLLKTTEGLSISIVLISHIYTIQMINITVVINEVLLLLIGIAVAWLLNFHVPNIESHINKSQLETERLMKMAFHKFHRQLLNYCSISEHPEIISDLGKEIEFGLNKSIEYNNNYLLKDNSYYIKYFQMRHEQYLLLSQIEKHFNQVFFSAKQSEELSQLTLHIEENLSECNDGKIKLDAANKLMVEYKNSQLPKTREEFENRAVLYQYLTDLIRFIEIKSSFIHTFGTFKYCSDK